jgi:hypothetical protein
MAAIVESRRRKKKVWRMGVIFEFRKLEIGGR